jgi:hypothetical protein
MDLLLALELAHWLAALVWAAGAAVLALILLIARRDAAAATRARPEAALVTARALRPATLALLLTGLPLAWAAGQLPEAWVILSAALAVATLVAGRLHVAPALAAGAPQPALRLAGLELAAQAAPFALMVAQPGWSETAILAGLIACVALAAALLREATDAPFRPAA